ncbi:MAG: glycosyltransferase family 4 protein [Verrucomicrobia bacterium]|nr:glycosyltransferase family 4 protein [Verrucomicrobiota bacterium]
MKIALLTTDNRWLYRQFHQETPAFGMAPEALISGLAALPDVEIHIVSCTRHPLKSPERLGPKVYFHSLHVPKIGWMRTGYLGCICAVRRRLRLIQPDIVHGHGTEFESAICAAHSGYPNVITLLGIMREMAKVLKARPGSFYWFAALLENHCLRRTAGVLANSTFTQEKVQHRTPRTWVVPNAVREVFFDSPLVPPMDPKASLHAPVLLNVGTVCTYKRQNELLDIAEQLHAEGLEFEIGFIGSATRGNPYVERFHARLPGLGFSSYHSFMPVPQLIAHYDRAAALVHVSAIESFGLVVAEALCRNLKFIGFNSGGVADIVAGVEGVEAFSDGDWAGLRGSLSRWLRIGAPRARMVANAMRQRYHPMEIARQHLKVYRDVLNCAR